MHRLINIQDALIQKVECQLSDLDCVDAEEMGEVIDMIKDIDETLYYHTIVEAMKSKEEVRTNEIYYNIIDSDELYNNNFNRSIDYFGASPIKRKKYLESKKMHYSKEKNLRGLNDYLHELTNDIMDMIEESSPEEKTILHDKIIELGNKIV